MARADNIAIAQDLLTRLGTNAPPDSVLELFADDVTWDVPGDPAAFPWIGRQTGRQSVLSFMAETVDKIERIAGQANREPDRNRICDRADDRRRPDRAVPNA
jgi:ketosteroid isomerase-like protein